MNVLLISYYFMLGFEGSSSIFTNIADLLAKNGHKVFVISHQFQGLQYKTHPNLNLVFVSSKLPYEGKAKTSLTETLRFTLEAWKKGLEIIKKNKIDIIHSNAIAGLAGSLLSFFSSKPHIMLIHDIYSTDPEFWKEWQKQEGNSSITAWLGRLWEKILVKSTYSGIHTVSEATKDDLIKFGVKKPIFVLPNAIPIKDAVVVKINPFQFVFVGRLVFYKNLQIIIKALKLLKEKFPQINLIIIGKGPYREHLEKLVIQNKLQKNIIFRGHVSEEEKNLLISSSQALVFPSLFEGFGLVILEAFMQKKPVLASDIRPLSDIVEHQKTGFLIPAFNEKDWAKAIEKIVKDQSMALKMGDAGRKVLENNYTIDKLGKQILEMYNDVLK